MALGNATELTRKPKEDPTQDLPADSSKEIRHDYAELGENKGVLGYESLHTPAAQAGSSIDDIELPSAGGQDARPSADLMLKVIGKDNLERVLGKLSDLDEQSLKADQRRHLLDFEEYKAKNKEIRTLIAAMNNAFRSGSGAAYEKAVDALLASFKHLNDNLDFEEKQGLKGKHSATGFRLYQDPKTGQLWGFSKDKNAFAGVDNLGEYIKPVSGVGFPESDATKWKSQQHGQEYEGHRLAGGVVFPLQRLEGAEAGYLNTGVRYGNSVPA